MEPTLNPIEPINGMLKFFLFWGLWPSQSKYRWIYGIYATIFHFIFTFAYLFFKLVNLFIETDLRLLTVGFFIFLGEFSLVARIVNLIANFNDISKCLNIIKEIRIFDDNEFKIMNDNLQFFSKVMSLCMICGTSACLCSWGAALFSADIILPYPAWYPIDWKMNNQNYWLAFSYQVISSTFQAYGVILLQLFSIYLMSVIGGQFDVLKYRLENLGHCITMEQREIENKFVECIQLHQNVLSFVKLVEKIFVVPFFIQFVTSSILFCFTAFKIATVTFLGQMLQRGDNRWRCWLCMNISEEIASFIFYISFSGVFLNQIFLACYFGNEIILKHQHLSKAIYSSEWINTPPRYRKMIVMLIEMLNVSIVIKTGKVFTLTLASFLTVINRSYSLFAVLQNTLSR